MSSADDAGGGFVLTFSKLLAVLPGPRKQLSRLLRSPVTYVTVVVIELVVGGLVELVATIVGTLFQVLRLLAEIPAILFGAFVAAGETLGNALLGLVSTISRLLGELTSGLGVAGPVVATVLFAGATWVAYLVMSRYVPVFAEVLRRL